MIELKTKIQNKELLDNTLLKTKDYKEFFNLVIEEYRKLVLQNIQTSGRTFNSPFRPLSEKYLEHKRKFYPTKKILQRTGKLEGAIQGRVNSIEDITEEEAIFGISLPYAAFVQNKRNFLFIDKKIPQIALEMIKKELLEHYGNN